MKKTDIAMIILIASISVGLAYATVSAIPGLQLSDDPVQVPTMERYSADVKEPDPAIFNEDAINPTVDVTIGGQSTSDD
ncbi:TPA: hypothetical protein DIV49_03470 [Candidatus Saccharibacteria bacterium]|nr:hypothetical protein [Candidatus Saccharibacteria bacterium]HRJ90626.1 hypothetical protein [Candidatus Saccharibacteria bacterium]